MALQQAAAINEKPTKTKPKSNKMKHLHKKLNSKFTTATTASITAACALAAALLTGCASNTNLKTPHVYQASGKGIKFGVVQDPVTGQYSFGFQSLYAGGMIVPINVSVNTNGQVNAIVPDAVMSYEIGGKGTFFGSADSTVTFAVGPNAVQTLLGGQHIPVNSPYWTNSATGLSTSLPTATTTTPTVTSTSATGTNSASSTKPIIINP